MSEYLIFYENIYKRKEKPEEHIEFEKIKGFIKDFNLSGKKCLEIGSAKGIFQNLVDDYTGLDVAKSLATYYKKPYVTVNEDGTYPFEDNTFDGIWSCDTHEHIPNLNQALIELKRVLKPGGIVYFAPAWQVSSWVAEGISVRPYKELTPKQKIIKALIPLRRSVLWRSLFVFPKRIFRHLLFIAGKKYDKMIYKKLKPNYEIFYTSDSDACNSLELHDAILWFESNGFRCISHPMHLKAFLVRTGALVFKKLELKHQNVQAPG